MRRPPARSVAASRARHPSGRDRGERLTAADITKSPTFRVGQCDRPGCTVHLQGDAAMWADHRRIVHGEGG